MARDRTGRDFMSEENKGYTIEQIGGSMFNAFRYAMDGRMANNQPIVPWQDLDERAQEAWTEAARQVAEMFQDDVGVVVSEAAKKAYETFCRVIGGGAVAVTYEAIRPVDKVAWQAVVRHAVNVMGMDDNEDLESHEMTWRDWVKQRCPQLENV